MPAKLPALAVDVKGLSKLVERRSKAFAVLELLQNGWDEDVTRVDVTLLYVGNGKAQLTVTDDAPEGFADLSHAYTLFAESSKKADPSKRGRFNLGEKLVIALADEFYVHTTKGGVEIDVKRNERKLLRKGRERGSEIGATLRMTRKEVEEAERVFFTLLPPPGVITTLNGRELPTRAPVRTFEERLRTEVADEEGYLRPRWRKTVVEVYEPLAGEEAAIYEMGLPVVATGDRYHVNVAQKIPLNTDRDNVTPTFLRDLRTAVLNTMADQLTPDDSAANWIDDALEDESVSEEAVEAVLTQRFGVKRVVFDPSDPEANKIAASEGYCVVPGRALSRDAWKNVKRAEALLPAGRVTPSPKPYSTTDNPQRVIPEEKWTAGMKLVSGFAEMVAREVLGRHSVDVRFISDITWSFAATYGSGRLTFNKGRLGNAFFEGGVTAEVIDLIIHEYGHETDSDHLSRGYYDALTRIGGKLALLAYERPDLFAPFLGERVLETA